MSRPDATTARPSRSRPGAPRWRPWAPALLLLAIAGALGAGPDDGADLEPVAPLDGLIARAQSAQAWAVAWYRTTPPAGRIAWGGLAACAALGLITALDRSIRLRRSRVIPAAFRDRFRDRLVDGGLDWAKGLDYCELNPSPAARVALAALRRTGRPTADLDRAVSLARQVEVDQLRRYLGTLRRVAAMAPLVGLLGSLLLVTRALALLPAGAAWGPVVAAALTPLTAGVALAIVALLLFDGLTGRVETLGNELDRIGTELVDAIAAATPVPRPQAPAPPAPAPRAAVSAPYRPDPAPRDRDRERGPHTPHTGHHAPQRGRGQQPQAPQSRRDRDRRRDHDDGYDF